MKENVLQVGDGTFLRSFIEYLFDQLEEKGCFTGKIIVAQPDKEGRIETLNEQDGQYSLFLRGKRNGTKISERHRITCISRGIDINKDYYNFIMCAHIEELRYIISDVKGICYRENEHIDDIPPESYPAKLTVFLYERYKSGLSGFVFLPCENVDNNADLLKKCVLRYAKSWRLEQKFINWIEKDNMFLNTFADRICMGYPIDEAKSINEYYCFEDKLINTAELYYEWAVEGNLEAELPFNQAECNVVWTESIAYYRHRRDRIYKASEMILALVSFGLGIQSYEKGMQNEHIKKILNQCIIEEIVPVLGENERDIEYVNLMFERLENPFFTQSVYGILDNGLTDFKNSIISSILEYKEMYDQYPKGLSFIVAALIFYYKKGKAVDTIENIQVFKKRQPVSILKHEEIWGTNLIEMLPMVKEDFEYLLKNGMKDTCKWLEF